MPGSRAFEPAVTGQHPAGRAAAAPTLSRRGLGLHAASPGGREVVGEAGVHGRVLRILPEPFLAPRDPRSCMLSHSQRLCAGCMRVIVERSALRLCQ